jgi:large subunit ribosomal protein L16
MLRPRQTKHKKMQKGRINPFYEYKSNKIKFGIYGLKALTTGRLTAAQIEAGRRALTSSMKRKGKIWIRAFPDYPVTSKPTEVRMGKGKGNIDYWACRVKPGKILYEIAGNNDKIMIQALKKASIKLPVLTKIVGPIV